MSSAPSATSPAALSTGGATRKIIQRVIFGGVAVVTLLLVLITALVYHFTYDACSNFDGRQKKVPAGYHSDDNGACIVDAPRVSQQQVIPPSQRPFSFRTVEIPPEGLPLYLYTGWKDFAFGGNITITTPGLEVLRDQPGNDNKWGYQPNGVYVFAADPVGSKRSVQIYNRW